MRVLDAAKPNQVWTSDMTKIWVAPGGGLHYLVCVIEWYTPEVEGAFLASLPDQGVAVYGERAVLARLPECSSATRVAPTTDNGTRFTSSRPIETLNRAGIAARRTAYRYMEGNKSIEWFHRSLNDAEIRTTENRSVGKCRNGIACQIVEYNHARLHRGIRNRILHKAILAFAGLTNNGALTI